MTFAPLMGLIARAYDAAPVFSAAAEPVWRQLARHSVERMVQLRGWLTVVEVADAQPYKTAWDMLEEVNHSSTLRVSNLNSEHPVWTPEDNLAFRVVHDIDGHCAALSTAGLAGGFSWDGEVGAFTVQASHTPRELHGALLTEVLGQAAWALTHTRFDLQKVAFL